MTGCTTALGVARSTPVGESRWTVKPITAPIRPCTLFSTSLGPGRFLAGFGASEAGAKRSGGPRCRGTRQQPEAHPGADVVAVVARAHGRAGRNFQSGAAEHVGKVLEHAGRRLDRKVVAGPHTRRAHFRFALLASHTARSNHRPFVNCSASTLRAVSRGETDYGRSKATRREGLAQQQPELSPP